MIKDYRVVKYANKHVVKLVGFDSNGNPASVTDIVPEAGTVEELSHLLIYQLSALTKPIIDAQVFEPLTIDDNAVKTALSMMRTKK